jgi:hypothetical protein
MIPGPYESNQGFVRSFIHLGASKHSFQGGFLYNSGALTAGLFCHFQAGLGLVHT